MTLINDSTIAMQYDSEEDLKNLTVDVYESFENLDRIRNEWDQFVEGVCGDIFMTYDWCRIWWKYYGKKRNLKIFVFRCEGDLVGIVPLFIEKIWLGPVFVRAVKIVGSDFTLTQFSLPIKEIYLGQVVAELADNLKELNWDIIHIGQLAGNYGSLGGLAKAIDVSFSPFAKVESRERGVQTYFNLEKSWDDQLLTLSKRERGDIRRNYRYIDKVVDDPDKSIQTVKADGDTFQTFFEGFAEMHQEQWNRLNKAGHFGDWPSSYDFHLEMASVQSVHGRLRLFKVLIDSDCLGYEYDYKFGKTYFEILNARSCDDKYKNVSLGKVVFSEQLKKAIEDDIFSIDSMRGKFDHKIKMGGGLSPVHSIYVVKKGQIRQLKVQLFKLLIELCQLLYYRIWFFKVSPKIKKNRNFLWTPWIRSRFFS